MTTYTWDAVPPLQRDRIEEGERALVKIDGNSRETFYDWLRVGEALNDMQQAAMALAGTNQAIGRGYNAAYAVIAERAPKLAAMDKSVRSKAIWMATKREAVEPWHASLSDAKKRLVNHPATVKRLFETETGIKEAKEPKAVTNRTAKRDLTDIAMRMETVVDKLELGRGSEFYDLSPELVHESVTNFVDIYEAGYGFDAVVRFSETLAEMVQARLKPNGSKPRPTPIDDFGARVKAARTAQSLKQAELAAATGLAQQAVSQIESGTRNATAEQRGKLAAVLGFSA